MNNSVIGLDIAKNIFHLFTLLDDGKTLKKKLKRMNCWRFLPTIQPVSLALKRAEVPITGPEN